MNRRRYVLGGTLVALGVVAAVLLADVIGTVFFAITVAYLLSPLQRRLTALGLSPWKASAVATFVSLLSLLVVAAPLVVVLAVRLEAILHALATAPESVTIDVFGVGYVVTVDDAILVARQLLRSFAQTLAREVPILALKLAVFVVVVFSLLFRRHEARRAVLAVVPPFYHDVLWSLHERSRSTLFAIYVLQAATAFGTFLFALPVFVGVGYQSAIMLAVVAAVLQFLPIVGPSVLLFVLAVYHFSVGDSQTAVFVLVVGGFVIAWLPDVLIRPHLARETAGLQGGLYFVGFVGGLLTFGAVGIVAGPLAVALVVEVADLLATELNAVPVTEE